MTFENNFLKLLFFLLVVLSVFHLTAIKYFLYWKVFWFDWFMHFFGGAWLALFIVWLFYFSGKFSISKYPPLLILILVSGFAVTAGFFWEILEFLFDVFFNGRGYFGRSQFGLKDTMSDLFFDFLGGIFVSLVFIHKFKKEKENA